MSEFSHHDPEGLADSPEVKQYVNELFLNAINNQLDRIELYPSDCRIVSIKNGLENTFYTESNHFFEGVVRRLELMADLEESEPWKQNNKQMGTIDLETNQGKFSFNILRYLTKFGDRYEIEKVIPTSN
jgi:hypothetical protein